MASWSRPHRVVDEGDIADHNFEGSTPLENSKHVPRAGQRLLRVQIASVIDSPSSAAWWRCVVRRTAAVATRVPGPIPRRWEDGLAAALDTYDDLG